MVIVPKNSDFKKGDYVMITKFDKKEVKQNDGKNKSTIRRGISRNKK